VRGLAGPVTSARLRLYVSDASLDGGELFAAPNDWTEKKITWRNAPLLGAAIGPLGPVSKGTWVEIDLGGAVTGDGTSSFALTSSSADGAAYDSSEGKHRPQLVITTG
jgi:hypothetical protein